MKVIPMMVGVVVMSLMLFGLWLTMKAQRCYPSAWYSRGPGYESRPNPVCPDGKPWWR